MISKQIALGYTLEKINVESKEIVLTKGSAKVKLHLFDPLDSPDAYVIYFEEFGMCHRDPSEGPAYAWRSQYYETFEYRVRGKLHRPVAEGPAYKQISLTSTGSNTERYWINGKIINEREVIIT